MAMSAITPGRLLLSLVALVTTFGGYLADWNKTHVYNDRWPPHCKFHNGQTMSMGLALGVTTLYYTWVSSSKATREAEQDALSTAAWIASIYWTTQMSGILYPGSLAIDPEFGEGFPQFWLGLILLGIIGGAWWLERSRIAKVKKVKA